MWSTRDMYSEWQAVVPQLVYSTYLVDGAAWEVQQVSWLQDDVQDGLANVLVSEVWA